MEIPKLSSRPQRAVEDAELVISRCCFAEDAKKCTKIYNARAQLFYSLNLLFGEVLWLPLSPRFA